MERDQNKDLFLVSNHPPLGNLVLDEGLALNDAPKSRRDHIGPLVISVLLHSLLLIIIFSFRAEPKTRASIATAPIRLHLLPQPPRQEATELEPGPSSNIEELAEPAGLAPVTSSRQIELPQTPAPTPTPEIVISPPDLKSLNPTTLSIRQVVEQLRSEEDERAVYHGCTELQKRSPMLDCDDELNTPFDDLDFVLGSEFQFVGSSANLSSGDADNLQRMARSLRNSGVSDEVIDQYLRDLDMSTRDSATSGDTRATALKDQMFLNDSTYQLMKRVLNP